MKKITGVLTIVIGLYACEKIPFDYRNKFVGDYVFTKRITFFYPPNNYLDTTYTDVFKGSIKHGKETNQIEIYYEDYFNSFGEVEKRKIQVIINQDGVIKGFDPSGKFVNSNKIEFNFPSKALGGVGGTTYTGIKKN